MCEVFSNDVDSRVVDLYEPDISLPGNVCVFVLVVDKCDLLLVLQQDKPEPLQLLHVRDSSGSMTNECQV